MAIQAAVKVKTDKGTNFTAIATGQLTQLDSYSLEVPALNRTVKGKLFIKDLTGMTGMQMSMN